MGAEPRSRLEAAAPQEVGHAHDSTRGRVGLHLAVWWGVTVDRARGKVEGANEPISQ